MCFLDENIKTRDKLKSLSGVGFRSFLYIRPIAKKYRQTNRTLMRPEPYKAYLKFGAISTLYDNITHEEVIHRINSISREAWLMRRLDLSKSIELAAEAFDASVNLNYKEGMAYCLRTLGVASFFRMQFQKALPDLQKARLLFMELDNHKATSSCYRNIGNIYTQIGVLDKATSSYEMAIEWARKSNDSKAIAYVNVNLGLIEQLKGNHLEAISILLNSLEVLEKFEDKLAISETYFNIGNNFVQAGAWEDAEKYLLKALEVSENLGYLKGVAQTFTVLGNLYFKRNQTEKALKFMHEGLATALELNEKRIASETYRTLAEVYKSNGNLKKAIECFEQYDEMRGKLSAHDSRSLLESLQGEIELEKSEKLLLESKNKELEYAYRLIKEKNKDITDSLKYAKHIQGALLPPDQFISELLKDFFIYYQPREIVSGDFYWVNYKNGLVYLAAVDCTGHGVPGAFISIVSSNCLNQVFGEKDHTNAAHMLDRVNTLFNQTIRQKYEESTVRDGMDISLCIIDFKKNSLSFSGANHNLYIVRDNELREVKGTKQPIGMFIGQEAKPFQEHICELKKEDRVYLFTDGYVDQFGGEYGDEKYLRKKLKKLLVSISGKELIQQKTLLKKEFNTWKGPNDQVDDVLVIGLKI